jgi:D-glycero-alpha-D-manno-heptose-7-phosphate kinase
MIISRTPFRISFFGGGTDYPVWYKEHSGAVLATSINKYSYITCRYLPPFFEHKFRIVYSKTETTQTVSEIQHPAVRATLDFMDIKNGVEIHHDGDLPARTGLGSSSSFTVGLVHALYALYGKMVTKRQLALDAIHVEQNILRENVGAQDQTSAAFGGFNKIEFGGSHHIQVNPITLNPVKCHNLQDHLMLYFTGFSRIASEIAGEQIKKTPDKQNELFKMREMVDEAIGILNGSDSDISDFGKLLHESWKIKRSLTDKISTPQIDKIYNDAFKAGALGGKLLGAGGGGFVLFFVEPEFQPAVRKK